MDIPEGATAFPQSGKAPAQPMSFNDAIMARLAREIAMDIRPLDDILKAFELDHNTWSFISQSPYFTHLVQMAKTEWEAADNTMARVQVKAGAIVEEALPEFYARLHDPKEVLSAKTELLKTIAKFANIGAERGGINASAPGERLVVTINLGNDNSLKIERNMEPSIIDISPDRTPEEDRL